MERHHLFLLWNLSLCAGSASVAGVRRSPKARLPLRLMSPICQVTNIPLQSASPSQEDIVASMTDDDTSARPFPSVASLYSFA